MTPSLKDLQAECRALKIKIGGNKLDLENRLAAYYGTNTAVGSTAGSTIPASEPSRSRAGSVASTASTSSTSSSRSRSGANSGEILLTKGSALATMMPKAAPMHRAVFACLKLCTDEPSKVYDVLVEPEILFQDLAPVESMLQLLVDSSGNIAPTSSHAANVRDLLGLTQKMWEGQSTINKTFVIKPQTGAFLKSFLGDSFKYTAPPETLGTPYQTGWGRGTKQSMEISIVNTAEALHNIRRRPTGETDEPDQPSDEKIKELIGRGCSFKRLIGQLKIKTASNKWLETLHQRIIIDELAAFDIWDKRFLPILDEEDRLKSDEELRAAFPPEGHAISKKELYKNLGLNLMEPEVARGILVDAHVRHIIDPIGADEFVAYTAAPDDPEVAAAESAALTAAMSRIKQGAREFLRWWSDSFPDPLVGIWPNDFNEQERKKMKALIMPFAMDPEKDLIRNGHVTATLDAAVQDILETGDFPGELNKGKNAAAVKNVLKAILSRKKLDAKKRSEKAASTGVTNTGDDEDEEEEEEEAGALTVRPAASGSKEAGKKRKASTPEEEEEEEDPDAMDIDQTVAKKPAGKRRRGGRGAATRDDDDMEA